MTDTTENTNVNTDVNAPVAYDDTVANSKKTYELLKPNTWFKGQTLKGSARKEIVGKKGSRKIDLTVAPLDAAGKKSKPTIKLTIWPWMRRADGTLPETDKQVYFLMRTIDPDFPKYGKKKKTGGWMDPDGNTCTKEAYQAQEKVVKAAIHKVSVDMWNDPTILERHVFFFNVKHRKADDGNVYQEVLFTRLEEPADGFETDPANFTCLESDLSFDSAE